MPYFMLVMGKQGICRGASSYRNNAGWHDVTDVARPLSGSGYQYHGRDELKRRVEVKMVSEPRGREIGGLLERDKILKWVAIEAVYNDKPYSWWTFFDVTSAGLFCGHRLQLAHRRLDRLHLRVPQRADELGRLAGGPFPHRFRRPASIRNASSIATPTRPC